MSEETENPLTVEVFTVEQLNELPAETRESIVSLEKNLPAKELKVLNPLVSELFKLKSLADLKFVPLPELSEGEKPSKEDLELHKSSIEGFKSAKKQIIAFKQASAAAKKAIKGPLDEMGKNVLTVEKGVNSIAESVLLSLEKNFDEYIKAEAEKTRIAAEKKAEKESAAIRAVSEENQQTQAMLAKSTLVTFLKYEILSGTEATVNNAITNYSKGKLIELRDLVRARSLSQMIKEFAKDVSILSEEEMQTIQAAYQQKVDSLVLAMNTRLEALEAAEQNNRLSSQLEETKENPMKHLDLKNIPENSVVEFKETAPVQMNPAVDGPRNFRLEAMTHVTNCMGYIAETIKAYEQTESLNPTALGQEEIRRMKGALIMLPKVKGYIEEKPAPKPPVA